MNWINCDESLPRKHADVLVWVIYESGISDFTDSYLDSKNIWAMGSAKNFKVTHWMAIDEPK